MALQLIICRCCGVAEASITPTTEYRGACSVRGLCRQPSGLGSRTLRVSGRDGLLKVPGCVSLAVMTVSHAGLGSRTHEVLGDVNCSRLLITRRWRS